MSTRTNTMKPEPMKTRKSSKNDKQKPMASDIKEAFKVVSDKKEKEKRDSIIASQEEGLSLSDKDAGTTPANAANEDSPFEETAQEDCHAHKSSVSVAIQVTPADFDHDNKCLLVDAEKQELLEAVKELTVKYNALDNLLNHPKQGIGSKIVGLTLRGDNLYTDIHGAASGVLVELAKLKQEVENNKKVMEHFEAAQTRMTAMIAENKRLTQDLLTTQGLLQRYSQKITVLEGKVLDLTKRGMEQNLVFHAVEEQPDPKAENCVQTIIEFTKEYLQVEIEEDDVWKAYRMGIIRRNRARPLFAKLSYQARDKIMEKVGLLKEKRNTHGQVRFISEQIPDGILETKKAVSKRASRLKEIENKKEKEQRRDIKVVGDKVLVAGELDKPDVTTPQPYELFPSAEEQSKIKAINGQIKEAHPGYVKNSSFIGLAVSVKSVQETNLAYKAVMQRFPFMDHVVMAYRLKEEDEFKFGSCDDTEYGGGECLARFLYKHKFRDTAVFVVRRYGGLHLGYDRFKALEDAAIEAMKLLQPDFVFE